MLDYGRLHKRAAAAGVVAVLLAVIWAVGTASAINVAGASAVSSAGYAVNTPTNITLSGMSTANAGKIKETISNATTTTVITFPYNFDLTGITGVTLNVSGGFTTTGSFSVSAQTVSIRWARTVPRGRTFSIVINGLRNASQPGSAATYGISGTITSNLGSTAITWPLASALISNTTTVTSITTVVDTSAVSVASTYTVGFTLGAQGRLAGSTAAGGNTITVTFPAGTTVPAGPLAGNVTINGTSPSAVSVAGQVVTLTMPTTMTIDPKLGQTAVSVVFKKAFGLINPATPSNTYQVQVKTSAESGVGSSAFYTIGVVVPTSVNLASSNQPVADWVLPGQVVAVDGFSLQKVQGTLPGTVTAVALADAGTAPASTISGVQVYQDNGDAAYGPGDVLLNTTPATFAGAATTVAFDAGKTQVLSDTLPHQYWVVYTFSPSATNLQTASSRVTSFTTTAPFTTLTAATGATFTVDTVGPSAAWTDPSVDATTITDPVNTLITGSATSVGAAVTTVTVRIKRDSDGLWWDGSAWGASPTTLTASGGLSWAYNWNFQPPVQDGTPSYTLYAGAIDSLGNVGPVATRSSIWVDNIGPVIMSAVALDGTHVQVTLSDAIVPTTSAGYAASFQISPSLAISNIGNTLDVTQKVITLQTAGQTIGQNYTITMLDGSLSDAVGNFNDTSTATFLSGAQPTLIVAQGTDPGRPTAEYYATRNATAVADEIWLSASGGSVKVTTMSVRGLDTVAALRSDVVTVTLFRDNGDGVFTNADTRLGSSAAFSADASGTAITFGSLNTTIAAGTPANFWIVYKIGPAPGSGNVVGSRVQNGDVSVNGSPTVPAFAAITSANSGLTIGIDTVLPSTPTTVHANAVATDSAEVTWTPSADALSGIAWYRVYRDGSFIATSAATTYTATGLNPGQTYTFSVSAVDQAGNESAQATASPVTMPPSPIWMSIATPDPGQGVNLGTVTPNTTVSMSGGTTVSVGGVGVNSYTLSVSAADLANAAPSTPPTMPSSVMTYATRGWATVGPVPFSTASTPVWTSAGTKYVWQQTYVFDYGITVPYIYDPGDYTTKIIFVVTQN